MEVVILPWPQRIEKIGILRILQHSQKKIPPKLFHNSKLASSKHSTPYDLQLHFNNTDLHGL